MAGRTAPSAPRGRPPLARRVLIFVVAAAAVAVLIAAATGDRGWLEVKRRRAAEAALQREVVELAAANAYLTAKIEALRKDPYVIEKIAREKLGYARPGEVIYVFPAPDDAPIGAP